MVKPAAQCSRCSNPPVTYLRYSGDHLCRHHFINFVNVRVQRQWRKQARFQRGDKLAVATSGGKDSSVALAVTAPLAERIGMELVAITVDEGIAGYRPPSIDTAAELCKDLDIEHVVYSFKQLVGEPLDRVVDPPGGQRRPRQPCSYCGVFRRRTLNLAAKEVGATWVVMGHNLDDIAQVIMMNICRGNVAKLVRLAPHATPQPGLIPRLLPLRTIPEKEVYLYALLKQLPFHDAVCPYYQGAQRNLYRELIFKLEADTPGTRHSILRSLDQLRPLLQDVTPRGTVHPCPHCDEPMSATSPMCKHCQLKVEVGLLDVASLNQQGDGMDEVGKV